MASYYEVGGVRVYYAGGEGSPLSSTTGAPVNIDEIRQSYNKDKLFEDPDFPANFSSIGNISGDSAQGLSKVALEAQKWQWLRVPQMAQGLKAKKVTFAYDGSGTGNPFNETDILQGKLGDCYYLAALAQLTTKPDKLRFVVPADNDNGFEPENYCGAFHFRLYDPAFDKWVDVVVDDRLPASSVLKLAGQIKSANPAFTKLTEVTRGAEAAEAWPALAEKAYAKYYGGYANVEGGFSNQAMINFTAGFGEMVNFRRNDNHAHIEGVNFSSPLERVKTLLQTYLGAKGFVGFDTFAATPADAAQGYGKDNYGLVNQHAYSVLGVQQVEEDNGEKHYIVKVRNPHGHGEWTGPFSDNDTIWDRIVNAPPRVSKDEGTFYIKIEDAIKYFEAAQFSLPDSKESDFFSVTLGKWTANLQNQELTHSHRTLKYFPAYKFELTQGDLSAAAKAALGERTFITLSMVLQGYKAQYANKPRISFGYYLYKITDESALDNVEDIYLYKQSEEFVNNSARDASRWAFLESAGTYLLSTWLDTTELPEELRGKDIGFTIRLYSPNQTELKVIPAQQF